MAEKKLTIGFQVAALVLAGAAVIWGCCMVYAALHPGASGEFGGYSVFFAALVDVPAGLVSLAVALAVKKGHLALRWVCLALSVVALALPFVTKAAWQSPIYPSQVASALPPRTPARLLQVGGCTESAVSCPYKTARPRFKDRNLGQARARRQTEAR